MAVVQEMVIEQETRTLPYPIYDGDGHIYEVQDSFHRHLPKKYRSAFQYVTVDGRTKLAVNGMISDYIPNPNFEVVAAPGSHEMWFRGNNPEGLSLREMTGDPLAKFLQKHGWEITTRVRCWQRSQTTGGRGQFLDVGLKCTISPLYQPPPVPSARRGQHGWYLTANINKKGQQEKPQAC